jgi:hypothetical protein
MKVGDLVKHRLNKGAWYGIITKHRVIGWGHSDNYYVVWQVAGRGWFYAGDLEVLNESR